MKGCRHLVFQLWANKVVFILFCLHYVYFLISDPMDDYDPCSPTESPDIEIDDDDILLHSGSSSRYVL